MQSLCRLAISLTVAVTLMGKSGAFQEVNDLLCSLNDLQSQATQSLVCFDQLEDPLMRIARFASNISELHQSLVDLQERCDTVKNMTGAVLTIPGIKLVGAPILLPLTSNFALLSRTVGMIETGTGVVVDSMSRLKEPFKSVILNTMAVEKITREVLTKASSGKQEVAKVAKEISMLDCGNTRSGLLGNMESAAMGMPVIPNKAKSELKDADDGCQDVRKFLEMVDSKITRRVEAGLLLANAEIEKLNDDISPIEDFLSAVDEVLNKTVCPEEIATIIEGQVEIRKKTAEELIEILSDKSEDFVDQAQDLLTLLGFTRLASRETANNSTRVKREACVSVREIMDGALDTVSRNKTVARILLKDVFSVGLPQRPHVSRRLKSLMVTLAPLKPMEDDLQINADKMLPSVDAISPFLAMDYGKTFWERPAQEELMTPRTCEGEEELVIPKQSETIFI